MDQLCQIYIPAVAGITPQRAFYSTNLSGTYRCKILGISWNDSTQNNDHRLIKVRSDCFRMPYGTFSNTIIFGNKTQYEQAYGGDHPLDLEVKSGQIDIELEPYIPYDNTGNNTFFFCILSLAVQKL
tara:strand:+ start:8810 stop:9190 length:381 start_codon:yes stop_codon:yes gene_type:complete